MRSFEKIQHFNQLVFPRHFHSNRYFPQLDGCCHLLWTQAQQQNGDRVPLWIPLHFQHVCAHQQHPFHLTVANIRHHPPELFHLQLHVLERLGEVRAPDAVNAAASDYIQDSGRRVLPVSIRIYEDQKEPDGDHDGDDGGDILRQFDLLHKHIFEY